MGSRIEAVIYGTPASPNGLPPGARPVALQGGLVMLPVTDDLAAWLEDADDGGRGVGPGWVLLRQPVAALARRLSAGGRALYVAGETFVRHDRADQAPAYRRVDKRFLIQCGLAVTSDT